MAKGDSKIGERGNILKPLQDRVSEASDKQLQSVVDEINKKPVEKRSDEEKMVRAVAMDELEKREPKKTLYNKGQVDTLTKDYTPQMFLGDLNEWDGTGAGLRRMAEQNMPRTLNIGGYEFKSDHNDIYRPPIDYEGKNLQNVVTIVTYQSTEKVGNEYPVIQIGIRARKRRGKTQAEIIRDGYTNKTRFW